MFCLIQRTWLQRMRANFPDILAKFQCIFVRLQSKFLITHISLVSLVRVSMEKKYIYIKSQLSMKSIDFNVAHINNIIGNYTVGKASAMHSKTICAIFGFGYSWAKESVCAPFIGVVLIENVFALRSFVYCYCFRLNLLKMWSYPYILYICEANDRSKYTQATITQINNNDLH